MLPRLGPSQLPPGLSTCQSGPGRKSTSITPSALASTNREYDSGTKIKVNGGAVSASTKSNQTFPPGKIFIELRFAFFGEIGINFTTLVWKLKLVSKAHNFIFK